MRGTGERYNNVWPRSASGVLPPKKPRGMQGMLHEKKKERKEERRGEEEGGEESRGKERRGERVTSPCSRIAKAFKSEISHIQRGKLQSESFIQTVTVLRNQSVSF